MKWLLPRVLYLMCISIFLSADCAHAQDPAAVMKAIRARLEQINDYEAEARFKTQIPFLKVPDADVTIYYKKPDKIKIKNKTGISLVPKETVSISLYSLVSSPSQPLDAGRDTIRGIPVRIIKLLPADENGELVLATLFIDIRRQLVVKAKTTTRENGTQEVELFYGKYQQTGLPDRIVFSFNTQDFKLPKGVTFDYDDGSAKKKTSESSKIQKGKIEITYLSYSINKGIAGSVFE